MHQGDQTVLSLRPGGGRGGAGGGGGGNSRLFSGSRFDSGAGAAAPSLAFGSFSSDLPFLRPHGGAPPSATGDSRFEGRERVRYTREQLLQLREAAVIADDILKIKREFESEVFGEEQIWGRAENNPPNQPQSRYSEPDNRDWRRPAQSFPSGEFNRDNREFGGRYDFRQPDGSQFNRQDQLNYQFSRVQMSSNQGGGPAPALIKAEVPWSAKRGNLSEKERVLKTVKG